MCTYYVRTHWNSQNQLTPRSTLFSFSHYDETRVARLLARPDSAPHTQPELEHGLIKAVFFDYDGVLTTDKTGSLTTVRYLSRRLNVGFDLVKEAFALHSAELTLGKTTHAAIWPEICQAVGRPIGIKLLYEAFESTPRNEGMFSVARRLRKSLCVGIITDNKSDRIAHLRKYQALDTLFDPIVVSAEIGTAKDGPEIFEYALARLGVRPQESIFIDNQRSNLVAPGAMGMKTLFHDDEQNDIMALTQWLKETISACASKA